MKKKKTIEKPILSGEKIAKKRKRKIVKKSNSHDDRCPLEFISVNV